VRPSLDCLSFGLHMSMIASTGQAFVRCSNYLERLHRAVRKPRRDYYFCVLLYFYDQVFWSLLKGYMFAWGKDPKLRFYRLKTDTKKYWPTMRHLISLIQKLCDIPTIITLTLKTWSETTWSKRWVKRFEHLIKKVEWTDLDTR
jgi:hypothetical protein